MPFINLAAPGVWPGVSPGGRAKRRLLRLVGAATAVAGIGTLTAAPASAAQTCTGRTDSNLCLSIDRRTDGRFNVHVGIDVHMPLDQAQEYVGDAGDPFIVRIRGEDSGRPAEFLFVVPITGLGASSESGLSADFDTIVSGSALDEDQGATDEIIAQVTLVDTDTNSVAGIFNSNRIVGNWPF
jgi:hypothetical protein